MAGLAADPAEKELRGLLSRPAHELQHARPGLRLHPIVPEVEAPRDPALRAQDDRGDGPSGRITGLLQQFGQGGYGRLEAVARVVEHAVRTRLEPREEGDVGRKGEGDVGVSPLEEDGVATKPVEGRSLDLPVSVHRKAVR